MTSSQSVGGHSIDESHGGTEKGNLNWQINLIAKYRYYQCPKNTGEWINRVVFNFAGGITVAKG